MNYELLLVNVSRDYSGFSEAFRDSIGQYMIASYLRQKDFKAFVFSGDTKNCKRILEKELENERTQVVGFYGLCQVFVGNFPLSVFYVNMLFTSLSLPSS